MTGEAEFNEGDIQIAAYLEDLERSGVKVLTFDSQKFGFSGVQEQGPLIDRLDTFIKEQGIDSKSLLLRGIRADRLPKIAQHFTDWPEHQSVYAFTLQQWRKLIKPPILKPIVDRIRDKVQPAGWRRTDEYISDPLNYSKFEWPYKNLEPVLLSCYDQSVFTQDPEHQYRWLNAGSDPTRGLRAVIKLTNTTNTSQNWPEEKDLMSVDAESV